jgi:inorganic pyrophosphatase/exopolyphosphatase
MLTHLNIALTALQLATGDLKQFNFNAVLFQGSVGFAVIETIDDLSMLNRVDELIIAMHEVKKERAVDILYLAVVDIVKLRSHLLLVGPLERSLAETAFPPLSSNANDTPIIPSMSETIYSLGGRVSRKKDFVPAITRCISRGDWNPKLAVNTADGVDQ